jgi:regulator of replication initiation timing
VSDKLVKTLESKVGDLIDLSTELKLENQALKKRLTDLQHEKRELLERQSDQSADSRRWRVTNNAPAHGEHRYIRQELSGRL